MAAAMNKRRRNDIIAGRSIEYIISEYSLSPLCFQGNVDSRHSCSIMRRHVLNGCMQVLFESGYY